MRKIALIALGELPEDALCEPLQLGYLAAFIKKELPGISVKIIDQAAGDDVEAELAGYAPDFVGITATTPVVNSAYRILAQCRKQGYGTIIGGAHASTMPEEAKQHADYVVVGEGEKALLSILTEQPPQGIIRGSHIQNIDDIPFPDRSLMNMEFYIRHNRKTPVQHYFFLKREMRIVTMLTSRGCPHECIYCYNSWSEHPVRYHSAERVVSEIIDTKNTYNIDVIYFCDDDIFINKPRLMDLCERIERAGVQVHWVGNARVSSVDKEALDAAYRAGCRQINYGIESGSQKVMDILKKRTTIKQAGEAIRMAKEAGIAVCSSFMIGTPGETLEDIRKTKAFIFSNPVDILSLSIATPYPGTGLWEHCKRHNLIPASFTWDGFRFEHGGISANEFFTHKQLVRMRFRILIELFFTFNIRFSLYYLRYPSYLVSRFIEALNSLLGLRSGRIGTLK